MDQLLLVKIGREARMRDFCENGTVFMRRLGAYMTMEGKVRGDPNEGLIAHYTAKNPTLKVHATVGGTRIPLKVANLKVSCSAKNHAVFCMSAIDVPGDGTFSADRDLAPFLRDKRLMEFGDTVIIFKDSKEFIRRLENAAKVSGQDLDAEGPGPVHYVPDSYCGKTGPYTKIGDYAYQQEFRFMTDKPICGESITLKLGSLMDIVLRLDLVEFHRTIAA